MVPAAPTCWGLPRGLRQASLALPTQGPAVLQRPPPGPGSAGARQAAPQLGFPGSSGGFLPATGFLFSQEKAAAAVLKSSLKCLPRHPDILGSLQHSPASAQTKRGRFSCHPWSSVLKEKAPGRTSSPPAAQGGRHPGAEGQPVPGP